jgi:addiction module RelE/StbE family toxin
MWDVFEHKRVEKNLAAAPAEVQKRYEKWKDIVTISGPQGLRHIRGFSDEALSGKWKGFRSSRLNIQYRVIYRVKKDKVLVQVEKVTPHDYGRA